MIYLIQTIKKHQDLRIKQMLLKQQDNTSEFILGYEAAVFELANFRADSSQLTFRYDEIQKFKEQYQKIKYQEILPEQLFQEIKNILRISKPNQLPQEKKGDITRFITNVEAKQLAQKYREYVHNNGDPEMERLSKFFTWIGKDLTIDEQRTRDNSKTNSFLTNKQIESRLKGAISNLKSRIQNSRFNSYKQAKLNTPKYENKIIPAQQSPLKSKPPFQIQQNDTILNETFWRSWKYFTQEAPKPITQKVSKYQQEKQELSDVEFNWNIDDQQFEGRDYQDSDVIQYHFFPMYTEKRANNKTSRFKVKSKNVTFFKSLSLINKKNNIQDPNKQLDEEKEVQTQQNFNFEIEISENDNDNFQDRFYP